jgi:lipoyl-dependent peroxiredoxin
MLASCERCAVIHPEQEVLMPIATRDAKIVWDGPLASGSGTLSSGSGALGQLPLTDRAPDGRRAPKS